jgi:GNAT superfamily N-acetyltransferase
VQSLDFERDLLLGFHGACGPLVALAHGAVCATPGGPVVEAAFSVDAAWRQRGLARALMRGVLQSAAEIGARRVEGLCALRNLPMRRVFEGAAMALERVEDEWHARRALDAAPLPAGQAICSMPAMAQPSPSPWRTRCHTSSNEVGAPPSASTTAPV